MGQAAIPLVMMAVATGAQAYNTHKTAKKQDAAAAEGIRRQSKMQQEANQRIQETLGFYETDSTAGLTGKLRQKYGDAARMKMQQAMANLEQVGATSNADATKTGAAKQRASDYGDFFATQYANTDAPLDQRRLEAYQRMNLGDDLGVTRRNSAAEDYLTRLRVSGIQRNPWLDIGAAVLNGAAGGMSGGFGGTQSAAGLGPLGNMSPQQFYNPVNSATLPGMSNAPTLYGMRPSGIGLKF